MSLHGYSNDDYELDDNVTLISKFNLMQFLMGLDDTFMQIRNSILLRETLPDVRSAHDIIFSEESYRVASGSISRTSQRSQAFAIYANVPNKGNFQRELESSSVNNVCLFILIYLALRLSHSADQVLNVLKSNLLFENSKSEIVCDICQRAKQTSEPFPLSDHASTEFGKLVHLDLWGPYKITSRDVVSEGVRSANLEDAQVNDNSEVMAVRCLINLVVQYGWTLYQMDVNNAFLYGHLSESVYLSLPPGYFPDNDNKVCKLNKSLYGLKQAHRQWNAKLTTTLIENGFVQSKSDYNLFTKSYGDTLLGFKVFLMLLELLLLS
ncbi:ribonuclease H-like domain-containing protein [Tanacetum coccineum]|uniref:Ribonuclease H-like domain-containing protein n=1 Tax=Tanacetum coccineum TaxID=301880 RepID=A0ABQ5AWW6_9ASTR